MGQIAVATLKEAATMYKLEVEKEVKRSDRGSDYNGGRDNVHPGGGEGGNEVRS